MRHNFAHPSKICQMLCFHVIFSESSQFPLKYMFTKHQTKSEERKPFVRKCKLNEEMIAGPSNVKHGA